MRTVSESQPQPHVLVDADREAAARATADVLARLRVVRAGERDKRRRGLAYTLYCTALLFAIWGVPLLLAAARAGADGRLAGPVAGRILPALPTLVPAVLAGVVLLLAARGGWQGPALLDRAAVTWLLPQPVLRRALLLPRFVASAVRVSLVAVAVGAVAGFLLHALGAGTWWGMTGAGAFGGGAAGFAGTALAVLVQRQDSDASVHRLPVFRVSRAVVAALWAVAGVSLVYGPWPGERLVLWSGPWGWAALPLTSAAGGPGVLAAGAGAVLTAVVLLVAGRHATGAVPHIPARVLRTQAGTALRVQASLYALDLRQARAAVRATRRRASRHTARLPLPRRPELVVPWRDATALLRTPERLRWALVWAGAAVALVSLEGVPAPVTLLALPAGYLAAAQLAEPARIETDDVRRAAQLPWSAGQLARRHGLVPTAGLLVLFALGGAAARAAGAWTDALVVLPLMVPALVGAALVSAYRGPVPAHLMLGSTTPLGDTGPLGALLWQVRGPLVALGCLAVVDGPARGTAPDAVGLLWPLVVGAATIWWAGVTARRTVRA
ncbi:hypothetical protein GCM10010145_58840 [Streptomyces ruber]|uniref:Uncharacterized protein n=2 Tax=Streptomyces TaxID=1883 RepID=A0A918BPA5_9ACTN|nr:DUF6297 family protein [Streptomyces ruber]GGQ81329.1 hypothetical protein GCM10010145_58840 [Streptomyces ruber]